MTKIKKLSTAAALGAALAVAFAGPAAAHESLLDSLTAHDASSNDVMVITGEDQYCNAQGVIVIIKNSCNGNGNNDSDGNGDVED